MTNQNNSPESEKPTLWGTFPLPDQDEIDQAWKQIIERRNATVAQTGMSPHGSEHRERFNELMEASPALRGMVDRLSFARAQTSVNPDSLKDYRAGVADFIEVIGTVALNRAFEGLGLEDPEA